MSRTPGRTAIPLLTPALAIVVAACSAVGAGPALTDEPPSASPSASGDAGTIDHATGATDVVLRYEEGGGFVMAGYAAAMVPHFTLYGDGTIVYRDPTLPVPEPSDGIARNGPLRTATLTEDQIQDVLKLALDQGGLAIAKPEYRYDMVADASTAVFTVSAAGGTKTVSVYALGIEDPAMPDLAARQNFAKLATALTSIESSGTIEATDYAPTAYRGILFESPGLVDPNARAWPWPEIAPSDFKPSADPNGFQFPYRTLTVDEGKQLGVDGYEGGLVNVVLEADGTTYQFSLRPLLPDEPE